MPWKDPEKRKAYDRKRNQYPERKEKNNERNRKRYYKNIEKEKERKKIYGQTENGIKTRFKAIWKSIGIICDYDAIYSIYKDTTHCDFCNNEFKNIYRGM